MKDLLVLGIETSCDETSAAVVKNGRQVLSNIILSQIDVHKIYGGVVPEIASRKHVEVIIQVIDEALKTANISLKQIDVIGVTYGPGLVGALLVGISAAKGLAFTLGKELVGVNHIEGHIAANYIEHQQLKPPFISLVVSGGHSHIVLVKDYTEFEIIGKTRDDAAGEAFDKISRALGLGYPGGPAIDKMSKLGNSQAIKLPKVKFENSYDFSFSGLKTAVINYINRTKQIKDEIKIEDICASFQKAVVDVLVDNTLCAAKEAKVATVAVAGGVAANSMLKKTLMEKGVEYGVNVFFPAPILCTDNAAMIASSAYYNYMAGNIAGLNLNAVPSLKIGENSLLDRIK